MSVFSLRSEKEEGSHREKEVFGAFSSLLVHPSKDQGPVWAVSVRKMCSDRGSVENCVVHGYVFECVCTLNGGQRSMAVVLLQASLSYILRQYPSLNRKLTGLARLTVQWAPETRPSPPSQGQARGQNVHS